MGAGRSTRAVGEAIHASVYAVRRNAAVRSQKRDAASTFTHVLRPECVGPSNTTCVYALRVSLQAARVTIAATSDCVCRDDKLKAQG